MASPLLFVFIFGESRTTKKNAIERVTQVALILES